MDIELVIAAVEVGSTSTFSGVNVHEDWSGNPEHDKVTNMGAGSALAFTGVMDTVA
jgi:hypothetical protein